MKTLKEYIEITDADTLRMSIPLFIRLMEFAKEDAEDDMILHSISERMSDLQKEGINVLTMEDYDDIIN